MLLKINFLSRFYIVFIEFSSRLLIYIYIEYPQASIFVIILYQLFIFCQYIIFLLQFRTDLLDTSWHPVSCYSDEGLFMQEKMSRYSMRSNLTL